MADQEPHSLASTFPNPPPFWRDFTPERVARIEELRSNRAEDRPEDAAAIAAGTARIPDLPEDLVNLQPPREPVDGRWRVFGDQYMVCCIRRRVGGCGFISALPCFASSCFASFSALRGGGGKGGGGARLNIWQTR